MVLRHRDEAVIIRGARAAEIWTALSPALRSPFMEADIVRSARDPRLQRVVQDILTELSEKSFFYDAREELPVPPRLHPDVVAYAFTHATRPTLQLRELDTTHFLVQGTSRVLAHEVCATLTEHGLSATFRPRRGARYAVSVKYRSGTGQHEIVGLHLAHRCLVGPIGGRPEDVTEALHRLETGVSATPRTRGSDELLIVQVLLAVLADRLGGDEDASPRFALIDPDLQVKLHALPTLMLPSDSGQPKELLNEGSNDPFTYLWESELRLIAEPHPRDLPQLPFGLVSGNTARGDALIAVAKTTHEARHLAAVHEILSLREITGTWTGAGLSPDAARLTALARLLDESAGTFTWSDVDAQDLAHTPEAAFHHATLTLRLGIDASVHASSTRIGTQPLFRVETTITLDPVRHISAFATDLESAQALSLTLSAHHGFARANATHGRVVTIPNVTTELAEALENSQLVQFHESVHGHVHFATGVWSR